MNPTQRTRIKICGITRIADALVAVEAGADAIGLVFAPKSPRCVDLETAEAIRAALPPFVSAVAVLRNQPIEACRVWTGDWIQLHGDESAQYVEALSNRRIIRALPFHPDALREWDGNLHVRALLVEGTNPGTGESFDHQQLDSLSPPLTKPILLAGGLTPGNVGEAIRRVRPYAVDVSSGVESSPGVKDHSKIRAFCDAVRDADARSDESILR